MLENMKDGGGEGGEKKRGEGGGIMVEIGDEFILLEGIGVGEKGKYGRGLVFVGKEGKEEEWIVRMVIEEVEGEGL